MNININLQVESRKLVLNSIELLKKQGFKFQEYEDWKKVEVHTLENRIDLYKKNNLDITKLKEHLKESLLIESFKTSQIFDYLDFQHRLISKKPRTIIYSKKFLCSNELADGLKLFERKVTQGETLFPHLSRQIFKASTQDGLLFDWGIHHFHLGTKPDKNHQHLIEGTRDVLYAMVNDNEMYFLTIGNHKDWANKRLLQIVKREFSHLIDHWKIDIILEPKESLSEKQLIAFRKAGASTCIELDGDVYFSPGGGINSAGGSMRATGQFQQICYWYEQAEKKIVEAMEKHYSAIKNNSKNIPKEINLEGMKQYTDKITVEDKSNNIKVSLAFHPESNQFGEVSIENN